MEQPTNIPEEVSRSFDIWLAHNKLRRKEDGKPTLQWDNVMGCYYFWWHQIFYGIELNGHLHT